MKELTRIQILLKKLDGKAIISDHALFEFETGKYHIKYKYDDIKKETTLILIKEKGGM